MILVDTSVWVDHLRAGDAPLIALLEKGEVLTHPFVLGELACLRLAQRATVLQLLAQLPRAAEATDDDVRGLIERHALMGRGLGWTDAHLLAAALLSDAGLMTREPALAKVARELAPTR
jgi:hypothetical protein